jgi:MarR family transcriptional regulator for hemolysin
MVTEAPPPLTSDLCWLLSRASHGLMTEFTAALEDSGISPRGHSVLATAMTGEHTQSEIARLVGLDKTTMVVTVDELERKGLAERLPSPTDRRARVIKVTDAGRAKVAEGQEIVMRVQNDVLETLPLSERGAFVAALIKLVAGRLSSAPQCVPPLRRREQRA